jgi:hypothetical protein
VAKFDPQKGNLRPKNAGRFARKRSALGKKHNVPPLKNVAPPPGKNPGSAPELGYWV